MDSSPPTTPQRVLAVAAHPDDVDFMCAGTMARWAAEGAEITYCVITDGTAGSRDPAMTHEALATIRRDEQRAAAAAVGAGEVIFLGYRDGRLEPTFALRLEIARLIRRYRPDILITMDPTVRWSSAFNYINHPDHIAAGDATLAAVMPTANTLLAAPELLAEGLEPHDVPEVFLSGWQNATTWVPLTEEHMAAKVAALREHRSQVEGWEIETAIKEWAANAAEAARAAGVDCQYAESFVRIVLRRPEPPTEATEREAASEAGV